MRKLTDGWHTVAMHKSIMSDEELEACGTDAYYRLDGRLSIANMVCKATDHYNQLNRCIGSRYTSFNLWHGRRFVCNIKLVAPHGGSYGE